MSTQKHRPAAIQHLLTGPLRGLFIAAGMSIVTAPFAPIADAQMAIAEIGVLPGKSGARAYGINNHGQVVGDSGGTAFLYSNGTIQPLGLPPSYRGEAWSISDSGQVAGSFYPSGNPTATRAFLHSNGTTQLLGTMDNGARSDGTSVNASGQVTGRSYVSSNFGLDYHAFLYSDGVMNDIGTLGGRFSYGLGINDAGQVVGFSSTESGGRHAFLYDDGLMRDLGTLGGSESTAYSIANNGLIVGGATTVLGVERAFLYSDGVMQDLGALMPNYSASSRALDINLSGQIVGSANVPRTAQDGSTHAFLYTNGAMSDLNSLIDHSGPFAMYVTLTEGVGINDEGWIIANGIDARDGSTRAYLLSPFVAAVPLPGAIWLLLSGLGGLAALRGSRSRAVG